MRLSQITRQPFIFSGFARIYNTALIFFIIVLTNIHQRKCDDIYHNVAKKFKRQWYQKSLQFKLKQALLPTNRAEYAQTEILNDDELKSKGYGRVPLPLLSPWKHLVNIVKNYETTKWLHIKASDLATSFCNVLVTHNLSSRAHSACLIFFDIVSKT